LWVGVWFLGGCAQYGGFLGMLASIGVPLALDLVKKILGKGIHTSGALEPHHLPPPRGQGMQIKPPPSYGTWKITETFHFPTLT